jgi:hypothetical protein
MPAFQPDDDVYPPFHIPNVNCDLILRSSDNVNFHVLKVFLAIASPTFRYDVTPTHSTVSSPNVRGIVQVEISSTVLNTLLTLCYPVPITGIADRLDTLDHIKEVLEAAQRYQMEAVIQVCGRALVEAHALEVEPLRAYLIASRHGLAQATRIAARHTLSFPLAARSYHTEMESVPASTLHRLNTYHLKSVRAAQDVVSSGRYEWIERDYSWFRCTCECATWPNGQNVVISGGRERHAAPFWINFMRRVEDALGETPCSSVAMRQDLLDAAIAEAKACATCARTTRFAVVDEMETFRFLLVGAIATAVSSVSGIVDMRRMSHHLHIPDSVPGS